MRISVILRRSLYGIAIACIGLSAMMLGIGAMLSAPARQTIGVAPSDVPARDIVLSTATQQHVRGWMVQGEAHAGVILLLHGVRADRRDMLGRARFLHRLGYSVLLIDLPGHGESEGETITFGHHEAFAVNAALTWLRQNFPGEKIGVIGVSLGAAAFVLARPDPPVDAVILESMYPTIAEAVADRLDLHLGRYGHLLAPLLLRQLSWQVGVSAEELRPIIDLPSLHSPLLIAAGDSDRHTTPAETSRLYAAANAPKTLWMVPGAAHVNLHAFDPLGYEARVGEFFARNLRDSRD